MTPARNPRLLLHQTIPSLFRNLMIDLIGQLISRSALFIGVGKNSDAIKLDIPDELEQLFKVFICFAGETCDEGRADTNARHPCTHALNQSLQTFSIAAALHKLQY